MSDERLLKLPEVSARLALSRTAIYRLMARGEIQSVHIGGALRFPSTAVDGLIETLKREDRRGETHAQTV